jgi:D-serine dehydratase
LFAFFREETSLKRELVYLGEAKTLKKGLLYEGALRRNSAPLWRALPAGVGSGIKYGGIAAIFYVAREGRSPSP